MEPKIVVVFQNAHFNENCHVSTKNKTATPNTTKKNMKYDSRLSNGFQSKQAKHLHSLLTDSDGISLNQAATFRFSVY